MKNLKSIKTQITQTNSKSVSLLDRLVQKNIKGGTACPPPVEDEITFG